MKKTKDKTYYGLKKLLFYVRKNKKFYSLMIALLIFGAVINLATPILKANAIGSLSSGSYTVALYIAIALICTRSISTLVVYFQNILYAKIDSEVKIDIKRSLITAITAVTMSKNDTTSSGIYIDRMTDDVGKCSDVMIDLMSVTFELISNIGFLIYIAFLNVYFFISLVLYVAILWIFDSKKERVWFRDRKVVKELREVSTGSYNEQIRGIRDVKSLNMRTNTIISSSKKFFDTVSKDLKSRFTRSKYSLARNICAVIFEVGFIIMGIFFIKYNLISLTSFLIIYMYHGNVRYLTQYIASIKAYAIEGELASRRVFEIIDEYPRESFGDIKIHDVVGKIQFKDVSFAYTEGRLVLKNINLDFDSNKITAIVGKSGSGKSTILSLINKLYKINSGEILIDGVEINTLTEDSLRDNVGVVTQIPYIFNDSIKENMLLVKPNATEEEIIKALEKAQIYDFIKALPEGMNSKIGENGIMLSGGQRQRFAIARVLLKNSKIIVLDEATSALDNENQNEIVKVIQELRKDHTIIIVAHRLSTIVDVDNIVVIDNGKVLAEGTHKQLMKKCNLYKELYRKEEEASQVEDN